MNGYLFPRKGQVLIIFLQVERWSYQLLDVPKLQLCAHDGLTPTCASCCSVGLFSEDESAAEMHQRMQNHIFLVVKRKQVIGS